jgi:taurine dioxygenase
MEHFDAIPLTFRFGTEIVGLDLTEALNEEEKSQVITLFNSASVLLFRNQALTPGQLSAFTETFGKQDIHHLAEGTFPDHPEVRVLSNKKKADGTLIGAYKGGHHWHSDLCFKEIPGQATLLYGAECPPEGADTLFADMHSAYENLPQDLKEKLEGRMATNDRNWRYSDLYPWRPALTEEQIAKVPPVQHPAVITHPQSGRRALYVTEMMVPHIDGMEDDEAQALVAEVETFATQKKYIYRHKWQTGDLVVWDNRSVLHKATSFDDTKYDRLMYRTQVLGEKPVFKPDAG